MKAQNTHLQKAQNIPILSNPLSASESSEQKEKQRILSNPLLNPILAHRSGASGRPHPSGARRWTSAALPAALTAFDLIPVPSYQETGGAFWPAAFRCFQVFSGGFSQVFSRCSIVFKSMCCFTICVHVFSCLSRLSCRPYLFGQYVFGVSESEHRHPNTNQ